MTHEELKKNGTLLAEKDFHDGSIYLYTVEIYKYGNDYYMYDCHPNQNRYTGRSGILGIQNDKAGDVGECMAMRGFKLGDLTECGEKLLSQQDINVLRYN